MNIQNYGTDRPIKEEFTLEDIKNRMSNGIGVSEPPATTSTSLMPTMDMSPVEFGQPDKIGQLEYDVPFEAVYDRRRDGSYTAKFKNYIGAYGNEDRLAKEQGFWEKAGRGFTRLGSKASLYALDATIGTAAGIINGIQTGELAGVWDNEVSNWIDDLNKDLDYSLPIYYSDEYKSQNILQNIGNDFSTFLFADLFDGLAFVGGALLPEVALAAATGGASLALTGARIGARSALKGAAKQTLKGEGKAALRAITKIENTAKRAKAMDLARTRYRTVLGKNIGEVGRTAGFIARTSNFEAGMEARHNFHDSVDKYYHDFEEINGRMPTMDEASEFYETARVAGNGVYGANMAILSVSNMAMFGARFGIANNTRARVNDFGNRFIGLSPKKLPGGKLKLGKATKSELIRGNAYKILSKPLIEGLYEEGLQGVAGETMQNWLEAKYNPDFDETYGLMAALSDGFSETYTTKEGWKEIGIGMIIGSIGGVVSGGSPAGTFGDSYSRARKDMNKKVDAVNAGIDTVQSNISSRMNSANAAKVFRDRMASKSEEAKNNGEIPPRMDQDNAIIAKQFIDSQIHLKSTDQILKDYEAIIESTELSEEMREEVGNEADYKAFMIEEFKGNLTNYKNAKAIVDSLGISNRMDLGLGKGNEVAVKDYLMTTMMLGQSAKDTANDIGLDIEEMIGQGGVIDAMNFYAELRDDQRKKVDTLNKKRRKLKAKKEQFAANGRRLVGLESRITRNFKDSTFEKRVNAAAEQHEILRQEVTQLEEELTTMEADLENETQANGFQVSEEGFDTSFEKISEKLDKLDKLDSYIQALDNNGREADANTLRYLVEQYKEANDINREMNNMFSLMANENFFSTKRGRGLIGSIVGPKYNMSEEMVELLRENNTKLDEQLGKVGIRGEGAVEERIKSLLESNPNLSDREKFKIESIIRMQLDIESRVQEAQNNYEQQEEALSQKETSVDPLEGDKITTRIRQVIAETEGTPVERLDKVIKVMLDAVDQRRAAYKKATSKEKATEKEATKETEEEVGEVSRTSQVQDLEGNTYSVNESDIITYETEAGPIRYITNENGDMVMLSDKNTDVVQEEVSEVEEPTPKLVGSQEYLRIEELNKKATKEELTDEEQAELEMLEDELDQWIAITGTVVDGHRLSDLIKLKNQLESLEVYDVDNAENLTAQQKLDGLFRDKKGSPNYEYGQSYSIATSIGITKNGKQYVSIQGLTREELELELPEGFNLQVVDSSEFPIEDQKNNIVITVEEAQRINEGDNGVMINPPSENLTTNYGVVVKERSSGYSTPIESRHGNDFSRPMKPNAIYDMEAGTEVDLQVDPTDPYNVELIEAYKNAENEEQRDKAKAELRRGMVIRVIANGEFVAVLKAKVEAEGVTKNLKTDMQFEAMRDELIDNEVFFTELIENNVPISQSDRNSKFPIQERLIVNQVLMGQPNFLMKKKADGSIEIQNKMFSEKEAKKAIDIGYVEEGKIKTRTGEKGIDTTFLKAFEKRKGKIPFVVIKKGKNRVAYPVTLDQRQKPDNNEFNEVFNSEASEINRMMRLNELLADRGVDIRDNGNNFNTQNINDSEFLAQKVAQVESIEYFYDLSEWTDGNREMSEILQEQAFIDINMSEPFVSPKIGIDFSTLKVDTTSYVKAQVQKNRAKKEGGDLVENDTLKALKDKKDDKTCK